MKKSNIVALVIFIIGFILIVVLPLCLKNKTKVETTWIISGADTIEIIGHYSWVHLGSPCGGHGHYDTITGRFTYTFSRCPEPDTFHVEKINYEKILDSIQP